MFPLIRGCVTLGSVVLFLATGEQVKAGLEEWSPGDIEIDRNASAIESSNTSWLLDNSLEATHRRDKRSVDFNTFSFEMIPGDERLGPGSTKEAFEYGDNLKYKVKINFPQSIATADTFELNLEIFTLEQSEGIGGFTLCSTHQESKGADVNYNPAVPEIAETPHETYANVIEKAIVPYKEITSATGDISAEVEFEAMLVHLPEVSGNEKRYITAGLEYANAEYIWVAHAEITTKATLKTLDQFPLKVEYASSTGDFPEPFEIKKGDSFVIKLTVYITNPSSSFKIEAFQPNGYADIIHVGQITTEWGDGFACSNMDLIEENVEKSPSGLSDTKYTISHPFLLNGDNTRTTASDQSRVIFNVPVHVMNLESVMVDIKRDIAISLYIGDSKMWAGFQEFVIKAADDSVLNPDPVNPVVIADVSLLNTGTIYTGDGVTYRIKVTVPSGWSNFDIELEEAEGAEAANVEIDDTGTVAYFPPRKTVAEEDNGIYKFNFGKVKNAAADATTVTLHVTFNLVSLVGAATEGMLKVKIGGVDVTLPGFSVVAPDPVASLSVVANNFGIDSILSNKLYVGGQVSLDLEVTVPVSSGAKDLYFEGVPDFDITTFSARLCRLRVTKVGKNLNCMESRSASGGGLSEATFYNKTLTTREFDDYGAINLGQACPIATENQKDEDNKFIANLAFEMPPQTAIEADKTMKLHGGIRVDGATIWVASNTYTTQTDEYGLSRAVVSGVTPEVTAPFVTDYPDVSLKDLTGYPGSVSFKKNSGFFVKYIIKTPPQTFGTYNFQVNMDDATNTYFKVCRLLLLQVGDNYPCTQAMPASPTGYETTILKYITTGPYNSSTNQDPKAGQKANYKFTGLANWGRDSMVADLTPDADSIQLVAFIQVTGAPDSSGAVPLKYRLQAGSTTYDGETSITLNNQQATDSGTIETIEWEYGKWENEKIVWDTTTNSLYKTATKLVRFKITIPDGYYGNPTFEVVNSEYDNNKHIEFCYMTVVDSGYNVPCVQPEQPSTKTSWKDQKDHNGDRVYKGMKIAFEKICTAKYSADPKESKITVEIGIRGKSDVADDTDINLTATVQDATATVPLKIQSDTSSLTVSTINPEDVKIHLDAASLAANSGLHLLKVHQSAWLKFYVEIPPETLSKVKLTAMAPSDDEEALFHINDIRFGNAGRNILCLGCYSDDTCTTEDSITNTGHRNDIKKLYGADFIKSENITAFMTRDVVQVDLGYVTNAGFTMLWGAHTSEDDRFAVEIEVIASDSAPMAHDRIFGVHLAATVGDTTVIGTQNIKITRDSNTEPKTDNRKTLERGNIIAAVQDTDVVTKAAGETLDVKLIIYHDASNTTRSMAEGKTTRVRIIGPKYLDYISGTNTFETNYTLNGEANNGVTFEKGPSNAFSNDKLSGIPTDIQFTHGIKFGDFVSINFTMTVDNDGIRPVGAGIQETAVILHPICIQNVFESYPENNDTKYVSCGSLTSRPFISDSGEKYDPIFSGMEECQVHASTMMDSTTKPFESTASATADLDKRAWKPALRTGRGWNEYLLFDFKVNARITMLKIGNDQNKIIDFVTKQEITVLPADSVTVEASNVAGNYYTVGKDLRPNANMIINFTSSAGSSFTARFAKVIITPKASTSADSYPLAVNQIQWYGSHPPITASCSSDLWASSASKITRDSTSPTKYRHFAYDLTHKIIYFCDLNPYKEGMFCYCSDRSDPEKNVWNEMPRYIDHIWGYSLNTRRMYFRDSSGAALLSSVDCKHFELTDEEKDVNTCDPNDYCANDLKSSDHKGLAVNVPGKSMLQFPDTEFPDSSIKGKFEGLYDGTKLLVKWRSCCE